MLGHFFFLPINIQYADLTDFYFSHLLCLLSYQDFLLLLKCLYFAFYLNGLAMYGILCSHLFALSIPKILFHCLLASVVADEKLTVSSIIGPL